MTQSTNLPAMQQPTVALAILESEDALAVVRESLAGEDFQPSDLDRIKVPAGGGTMWEIPTADGVVNAPAFVGVILFSKAGRAYWEKEFSGENSPPDCVSSDNVCGIGTPGGDCASCPFSQYESSAKGKGKACREKRTLLVLGQDDLFPTVLSVPPSSIKEFKQYMLRLLKKGTKLSHVLTTIGLKKDKNAGGITYSKIDFSSAGALTPEQRAKIESYGAAFGSAFNAAHADDLARSESDLPSDAPEGANPFGGEQAEG